MLKGKETKRVVTRIRTGDIVQLLKGKDRKGRARRMKEGLTPNDVSPHGKVLSINFITGKAKVEGLNMVYKHQSTKGKNQQQPKAGRVQQEAGIPLANLMIVCPKCNEATRIGIRNENVQDSVGNMRIKRIRICKKCGGEVPEVK